MARGTQTRGMLVFDEEGSSVVLPRTLEMFQDEAEGEGGMCWTCNEYEVNCRSFQESWFQDGPWEVNRLEDWVLSNEDACEGDEVFGWE